MVVVGTMVVVVMMMMIFWKGCSNGESHKTQTNQELVEEAKRIIFI
jgi:hypothetical protein